MVVIVVVVVVVFFPCVCDFFWLSFVLHLAVGEKGGVHFLDNVTLALCVRVCVCVCLCFMRKR